MVAIMEVSGQISPSYIASIAAILALSLALPQVVRWLHEAWRKVSLQAKRHLCSAKPKSSSVEEPAPVVSKALDFPDDWWTSESLFQLEKRAIFSKVRNPRWISPIDLLMLSQTWLHVCHSSQLPKPGDFRTFEFADFSFMLIRGKDDQLRAFHNVCRHRAYNVTNRSAGRANVLMCRYHGWTYDNQGKLIKAPKFEEVSGFDKNQNGLFEIRTFIDSSGFVYANFDVYGSDGLTIRVGVPIRARLHLIDSWTVGADFNWKIAVIPGAFTVHSLVSLSRTANMLSMISTAYESWTWPAEIELSSLTRVLRSMTGELWLTISVVPVTQSTTKIQCAFYTSQPEGKKTYPVEAVKRETTESVHALEAMFKEAITSGTIPGSSNQEPLLHEIKAHTRLERLMRQEVHPASRLRETSQACRVADDLCRELEDIQARDAGIPGEGIGSLAW